MRSNGTTDRNRYLKSKDTLFLLSRTSREGTLKSTTESTHLETAPGVANSFIFNFFLLLFAFSFSLFILSLLFVTVMFLDEESTVFLLHSKLLQVGRRARQSFPALHSCEGPDGLHCTDSKGARVGFVGRWGCKEIGSRGRERAGH